MLDRDFSRPDSAGVVAFVDHRAERGRRRGDGVSLAPGGIPTAIDVAFAGRRRVYPLGRPKVSYDPFRILAPPPRDRGRGPGRRRRVAGRRVFMLLAPKGPLSGQAIAAVPAGYRRVESRTFAGLNRIEVLVFAR